jgi:DNA-binding CsgD family transcriptional regulator
MACADDAFALDALLSHRANVCEALRVPVDMFAGIASEPAYRQQLIRQAWPAGFLSGIHSPASVAVAERSGTFFGAIASCACRKRKLEHIDGVARPRSATNARARAAHITPNRPTPAETKVLASLFAGRTLAETATTLGITRPTAKTHLGHIFGKTGVTRQAELMRLWTGLISPAGSNM